MYGLAGAAMPPFDCFFPLVADIAPPLSRTCELYTAVGFRKRPFFLLGATLPPSHAAPAASQHLARFLPAAEGHGAKH
jgi:hypothetical protein